MHYKNRTFNIGFTYDGCDVVGGIDETQFDVESCMDFESIAKELIGLFNDFVDENDFKNVRVLYIEEVLYEDGET